MSVPPKSPELVVALPPQPPELYRIVLTGGPCGGKTTALTEVAERLRSTGLQVFMVPENATIFSNAGAGFPVHAPKQHQMCWESSRIQCQMAMEDSFQRIARSSGRTSVILCDRGTVDAAAYMPESTWQELLEQMQWTVPLLCQNRYDLVIHMVSTAIGAESFYTQDNNTARRETVKEAADLDLRIRDVWKQHQRRHIIDNSTNFAGKIMRVVEAICNHLGLLSPTGFWQRYLVDKSITAKLPEIAETAKFELFDVTYHFLAGSTDLENQCIRLRVQSEVATYSLSRKFKQPNGEITIVESSITWKEYHQFLRHRDRALKPFKRLRRSFLFNNKYFELDEHEDMFILQVEVHANETVAIPPWCQPFIQRNITNDPNYFLFNLAAKADHTGDSPTSLPLPTGPIQPIVL